jgi:hypothetical protein
MLEAPAACCFIMSASGRPIGVAGPRARIWSSDAAPAPKDLPGRPVDWLAGHAPPAP